MNRPALLFAACALLASMGQISAQVTTGIGSNAPASALSDLPIEVSASGALELAYQTLKAGQWSQAEALFQQVIDEAPNSPGPRLAQVEAIYNQGRIEEAESLLHGIVTRFPDNPNPLVALARLHVSKRQFPEAEALLRQALKLQSAHHIYLDLGTLLATDESRLDEAMALLIEASRLKPTDAGTHYALGTTFAKMGEWKQATAQFEETVSLAPDQVQAWKALANSQLSQKEVAAAQDVYERGIRAIPTSPVLLTDAADLLDVSGQKTEAEALFRRATQLNDADANPWFRLGIFLHRNTRYPEADAAYAAALARAPDSVAVLNNRAALALVSPEVDSQSALEAIRHALTLAPENAEALDTYGQLLESQNKPATALEAYTHALQRVPESPLLQFRIARVKLALGQKDQARAELVELLKGEKSFPLRAEAEKLLAAIQD